jgi:serine/threonine protein phosphatase PrpC
MVLADGMGGHSGGALASAAVTAVAGRLFTRFRPQSDNPGDFLRQVINAVHQEINLIGKREDLTPHSTGVFLLLTNGHAHWGHVGDSRLYHFRHGKLLVRTLDHSMVQLLKEMGKIKEEAMAKHPDQGRLLTSLGGSEQPDPSFGSAPVQEGDAFLLCSDGLWETIQLPEMAAAFGGQDLAAAARDLVDQAAQRGGVKGDNVSVVLARFGPAWQGKAPWAPAAWPSALNLLAIATLVLALVALLLFFQQSRNP